MTEFTRRAVVAASGVALTGGCIGGSRARRGRPTVQSASVSVADDVPLSLRFRTDRSRFEEPNPAKLSLEIEWRGDAPIQFGTDPALFVPPGRSDDPRGLLLVHTSDDAWRADGTWVAESVAIPAVQDPHDPIPPEGRRTQTYEVWGDGDHTNRLRADTYRFSPDRPVEIGGVERTVGLAASVTVERTG